MNKCTEKFNNGLIKEKIRPSFLCSECVRPLQLQHLPSTEFRYGTFYNGVLVIMSKYDDFHATKDYSRFSQNAGIHRNCCFICNNR